MILFVTCYFSTEKENNDASSLVIKDRPGPPRFTDLMFL